jgi:C-terminal peptidase prc
VQEVAPGEALQLLAEVMTKVPVTYVNRDRSRPQQLWENGLEELSHALDDDAFHNWIFPQATAALLQQFKMELQHWRQTPIDNPRQARQTLRRLLTHWQEQTPITDPTAIVLEVVHGACNGLDESSAFVPPLPPPPEDLQPQGVCLQLKNGQLRIVGIIRGSWAEQHTPLQAGQVIVQINGYDLSQNAVTWDVIREALRHPQQGWHELSVLTGDAAIPELVVGLPVDPPSVYGKALKVSRSGIRVGYLRVGLFRDSTPRELDSALASLQQDGVQALVLDLRGNIGGSFTAALELARRFLPKGTIVTTEGQVPEVNNVSFTSDSGMAASTIPLVVLVDGETASAAEVLAAALKDQQRATLIGAPTFGKGTLQYPLALEWLDTAAADGTTSQKMPKSPKGGTVRLTIARLISPAGYPLHATGVQPHILETDPHNQLTLAFQKAIELAQIADPLPSPMSPSDQPEPTPMPPSTLPMYQFPTPEPPGLLPIPYS